MPAFPRTLLSLAVAATLASEFAVAAEEGHDEGSGNNLSTPVIWSDGIVKVLRLYNDDPEAVLLNGISSECVEIPGATCFQQKDADNIWQAESWDATAAATSYGTVMDAVVDGLRIDELDWGDNLEARDWGAHSKVRVESILWQTLGGGGNHDLPAFKAYEMSYLSGQGPTEVWGTTGVTFDSTEATVYSDCARLTIQKIGAVDDEIPVLAWDPINSRWDDLPVYFNGAVWEAGEGPGFYSSETNVSGKVIYGYNWSVGTHGDGEGLYRLTFSLDGSSPGGQPCGTTTLNTLLDSATIRERVEEGEEEEPAEGEDHGPGGGTPVIDTLNNLSYIDVRIQPAGSGGGGHSGGGSGCGGGGGGGGGGHSGGGGGGPVVTADYISVSGASGYVGTFLAGDTLTVTWNNGPDGDNHAGANQVTADFSALGGDSAVAATNSDGIWTATFPIDSNTTCGTGFSVAITATSPGGSATGISAANINVDVVNPTLTQTSPRDNSTHVSFDDNLTLYFSEAVLTGDGENSITLHYGSGEVVESIPANDQQVTISGSTVTVNPQAYFNPGASYYITVGKDSFTDTAGNAFAGIADSNTLDFQVETPLPPAIDTNIQNDGTLLNPVIDQHGVVEGGTLMGTVTNSGLIRDVSLAPGTVVNGGRVAGIISGSPTAPARIRATVTSGAVLSNVIIDASAVLEPGVVLAGNVCFDTLANVPPGMDLTLAQGGTPWIHGPPGLLALDLNHSLVLSGAEQLSLLRSIQLVDSVERSGAVVEAVEGSGELTVISDESRARLLPIALHRAAPDAEPGAYFDEDGGVRIVTANGLELTGLPLIDDVDTLRREAEQSSPPLLLEFDGNGNFVARTGGDSRAGIWMGRGDILAVKTADGGTTGLIGQSPGEPGVGIIYSLLYEAEDGSFYRQDLLPVPMDWAALKTTLQSLAGATDVRMDSRGIISVRVDGRDYRGRPDYRITRDATGSPADGEVSFSSAGDINGDGIDDVHMQFPNGYAQILYILP